MKAVIIICLILSIFIFGCSKQMPNSSDTNDNDVDVSGVDMSDLKYCETDDNCVIQYNILYNNQCSAGCFNKNSEVDNSCDLKWEPSSPDKICVCNNNICS